MSVVYHGKLSLERRVFDDERRSIRIRRARR